MIFKKLHLGHFLFKFILLFFNLCFIMDYGWASLLAQMVKNLPAVQQTWLQSLDWEEPMAWRIPWTAYSDMTK